MAQKKKRNGEPKQKPGPKKNVKQKPADETLSHGIEVRFTPADYALVVQAADQAGLTRSRFSRDAIVTRARGIVGANGER